MAIDTSRLSESEKLRIIEDVITDPRYPHPLSPLTKEDKLELFETLVKEDAIRLSSLIPRSERLRIVDELLKSPRNPIPREVARSLPEAVKLEMFDQAFEEGTIKLG